MFYCVAMGDDEKTMAETQGVWSVPEHRRRGRGAVANVAARFEPYAVERVDDGWDTGAEVDQPLLRTEVAEERPRTIITRNASPDLGFDRSVNAYRGCEHGCIYCFARPSHAYLGLSPGLDFETRLTAKPEAPQRLAAELRKRGYTPAALAMGTNTDPYQPIEKRYRITRGLLEVLAAHRHPVGIVTKGSLIERDLDILGEMASEGLARVGVSLTTLDPIVSRAMEPRVPAPKRRLQMIERLAKAGVPVRVMVSPVVPGLTDHELEAVMEAAQQAGAGSAGYILLRLPREVAPMFEAWLGEHFPGRAVRVMSKMRQMRGGADYDGTWGKRMVGQGAHAELLARRFQITAKRLGLATKMPRLRCDLFRVPPEQGDQLDLFG